MTIAPQTPPEAVVAALSIVVGAACLHPTRSSDDGARGLERDGSPRSTNVKEVRLAWSGWSSPDLIVHKHELIH